MKVNKFYVDTFVLVETLKKMTTCMLAGDNYARWAQYRNRSKESFTVTLKSLGSVVKIKTFTHKTTTPCRKNIAQSNFEAKEFKIQEQLCLNCCMRKELFCIGKKSVVK